jgi:aryl-alcohol dehydrogenase-like predicted oxidoreductase
VYGLGHSEEVVARALAEWAWCSAHVFTKCGLRSVGSGKVYEVLKTDSILRECEDSLRRLGVEAIDLYQIHWPVETSLCPGISWRRRPARPHRPFEKLCWSLSSQADEQESIRLIRSAIDGGITFMDNCWDYNGGASEIRMGKALRDGYRDKVFLMTKIDRRTKESAAPQIDESLQRLQTDRIDLMQFHEIIRMEHPDRIFAEGGAMEAIQAAKQAGKIRYIGFTGHKDPLVHLRMHEIAANQKFRFDAEQMPLNVMDAHFRSFEH